MPTIALQAGGECFKGVRASQKDLTRKGNQEVYSFIIMDKDLCTGKGCPIRNKCERYRLDERAYYFHPQYSGGNCFLFIPKITNDGKTMGRKKNSKI